MLNMLDSQLPLLAQGPPYTGREFVLLAVLSLMVFAAVYMFARYGWPTAMVHEQRLERRYQKVLNQQLLLNISPRAAVVLSVAGVILPGVALAYLGGAAWWFIIGAAAGLIFPQMIIRHLEKKRNQRLDEQLVDGITSLASGVRAGLTLVQSMEVLVQNERGPIKQEFEQLLREYNMGLDLNQAMRNAANRIGLQNYRLLFTALEMHRIRGGDTGESLDRIAEAVREIQRLEGKLDAVTSQGRSQARMMAVMPFVVLAILYFIMPDDVRLLFEDPIGRIILLLVGLLILGGFMWIRRIMSVDI